IAPLIGSPSALAKDVSRRSPACGPEVEDRQVSPRAELDVPPVPEPEESGLIPRADLGDRHWTEPALQDYPGHDSAVEVETGHSARALLKLLLQRVRCVVSDEEIHLALPRGIQE